MYTKSLKSIVLFVLALILVLMVWGMAGVQAESGGWFPFRADVCQTGVLSYRITLTATDEAFVHVGWVLDLAYEDMQQGDGWITSEHPVEWSFDLPDNMTSNGITIFYISATWEWAYRFELTDETPDCDSVAGGGGLPCDPSADENAALITFAVAAELLWAPDEAAGTGQWVQAGQTAWVNGYEDSYSRIVWSCASLWVDSGALAWEE